MSPSRLEAVAWASLLVLGGAAAFEGLVAIEVIPFGSEPGEGAAGGGVVFVAALLAFLCAAVASFAHAQTARPERRLVWIALAPVGVMYVVVRWYSFDPYFAPTLRRYSEGAVSGAGIAGLALAAVAVAGLASVLPRGGAVAASVVLLVSALTAWALGIGH